MIKMMALIARRPDLSREESLGRLAITVFCATVRLRLAVAAGLVPLARRRRGIVRCLRRQVQPLTQRRVLRDQRIDPSQQPNSARISASLSAEDSEEKSG